MEFTIGSEVKWWDGTIVHTGHIVSEVTISGMACWRIQSNNTMLDCSKDGILELHNHALSKE